MKLPSPFTIYDLRFTIGKKSFAPVSALPRASAVDLQPSTFNLQPAQRGVALVITLILLSVTLIMALALLALANRERNSVNTTTDTAQARLAADSALAAAQAQILANIFATNNGALNFGPLVSTNYINDTNDYYGYTNGTLLTGSDFIEAATNQMIFPRAPVFLTNALTGTTDFRFYLDLNRNGQFDASGNVLETNSAGLPTGNTVLETGDPQWIGVLARPDATHSANNQFIQRYAFFALPIGNALDFNAIHNASILAQVNSGPNNNFSDSFFRNQGVGSWEINLAAFLADLNTNAWDTTASPYYYGETNFNNDTGAAFEDAQSLLSYRYGFNYANQAPLGALSANALLLQNNYPADLFPYGPLMTNTSLPYFGYGNNTNNAWAGSANTNQFFDLMTELYDTSKVSGNAITGFTNHLISVATNLDTYDRYTFYRMLAQIGTDSDPDAGKMNLNYSNVFVGYNIYGVATNITVIPGAETNLVSWMPTNFFIAAANRMLLNYSANWFANSPSNYLQTYYGVITNYYHYDANGYYITNDPTGFGLTNTPVFGNNNQLPFALTNGVPAFGVTNIPVYVNGQFVYTPAVNRVLQLAANLYDASTNYYFPSVFRPTFLAVLQNGFTNVYINGYQQVISVSGTNDLRLSAPIDVNYLLTGNSVANYANGVNVYNVPWIIGAKKSFPNFNNFSEENQVGVIRRLEITSNGSTVATNIMYMMNLQSAIGADFWNSYASNYNDSVAIVVQGNVNMGLTNNDQGTFSSNLAYILDNLNLNYLSSGIGASGSGGINASSIDSGGMGYAYAFSTTRDPVTAPWYGTTPPNSGGNKPLPGSLITWSNIVTVLPFSVYRSFTASSSSYPAGSSAPNLIPTNYFNGSSISQIYDTNRPDSFIGYQLPQFGLLTTNRFQAYILDTSVIPNRVIDYVQFSQQSFLNVNANIFTNVTDSVWSTNTGIANQTLISALGVTTTGGAIDQFTDGQQWNTLDRQTSMGNFANVLLGGSNTQVQAGFTPVCTAVGYTVWSANDPLVHYTVGDLTPFGLVLPGRVPGSVSGQSATAISATLPTLNSLGLGGVNPNYAPWGFTNNTATFPATSTGGKNFIITNGYSFWMKDSLAYSSGNWDFPTNKYPAVGWMGRVHRGTPWQTVYLKSTDVLNDFGTNNIELANGMYVNNGQVVWSDWTGDQNLYDSGNSAPAFDWQLFDLFTTALNDNATRGTLSVNVGANNSSLNQADSQSLAAWAAVLSGVAVPTSTTNSYAIINPAGVPGTNSALWQIVNNINATRATFINNPDGVVGTFEHAGDVLRTPYLTEGLSSVSPLLAGMNANYINDEVYEAIPQQIMGLLRVSSTPRYVIYGYGQTLRPAQHGKVLENSENEFGLVTNYQVVAESAVRAVVSVQTNIVVTPTGFQTNYTTKVESYNVLPPD